MRTIAATLCSSALFCTSAGNALAADATPATGITPALTQVTTATGTEGTDVSQIVVTAEKSTAAASAPSKAFLLETQPESFITHRFIEQSTPETGDYTTAVGIAPSVNSFGANGGGIGDVGSATMRGFQDGQFNITYDGIAFGDANDTTHHPAAFFPGSTIGTAVVDRGPGAAGDMGQANFGGALHLFSPQVDDKFGLSQKATYGTFNTQSYVTTFQSGAIKELGGAKLLLSADIRSSDGELSNMGGNSRNFLAKLVVPIGSDATLTAYSSINHIHYNQTDNTSGTIVGFGISAPQQAAYGINFALNNDPTDEHCACYNYVIKNTSFNYLNLKWNVGHGITIEDHLYYYYYDNQTISSQSAGDLLNPPTTGPNAGTSYYVNAAGVTTTDIDGYKKQNKYDTYGNILRLNADLGFGTLRTGGLYEHSNATRFIANYDLTTNTPDTTATYGSAAAVAGPNTPVPASLANYQYYEPSSWNQFQLFADFEWRPLSNLTVTPGIKYLHYVRSVDNALETGTALDGTGVFYTNGSRTYEKTMWFITANYRVQPNWSFYAQAATGFLVPPVKTVAAVANGTVSTTAPQTTTTYQVGSVYSAGHLTLDGDFYYIDANNVLVASKHSGCFCFLNTGTGRYYGWEAQGAFDLGMGFTAFGNGSINIARDIGDGVDYSNAPKRTAAFGLLWNYQHWQASVSDKIIGPQLASDGATFLPSYATIDTSISYDLGKVKLKLAAFNLRNTRPRFDYDGTFSVYQVGRQIQATLQVKY
jgi:iron complex outermembrane receptor protein